MTEHTAAEKRILKEWKASLGAVDAGLDPAIGYPYGWALADEIGQEDDWGDANEGPITVEHIVSVVARAFGVHREKIISRSMTSKACRARCACYSLASHYCPHMTLMEITKDMGRRDHSTVSSGIKYAARLLSSCSGFKERYMMASRSLKSRRDRITEV